VSDIERLTQATLLGFDTTSTLSTSLLNTFIRHVGQREKKQYKTEKDTTDTYKDKRNIQIQKYFKQP